MASLRAASPLPPLSSAHGVLRLLSPHTLALQHVVDELSAFLDVSVLVSLPEAAASGSVRLFERVTSRVLADCRLDAVLRDHWFARAMEAAIRSGDLPMVQLIHIFHPEPLVLLSLRLALEFGSLEMAQWMIEHRHDRLCCPPGLENLCHSCWLKALQATSDREVCRTVKWAMDQRLPVVLNGEDHNKSPLYRAMLLSVDLLKWGDENGLLDPADFSEVVLLRDGGHCRNPGVALVRRAIQTASAPIEVVQYLIDSRFAPVIPTASLLNSLIMASCQGREQVVEYVLSTYLCDEIRDHVTYAPTRPGGNRVFQFGDDPKDIAKWGRDSTQRSASKYGHVDSLRWLFETHATCDRVHTSEADEENLLERFIWIQQKGDRAGGWHTLDIDLAAERGQLRAVQWLQKNRTEGCTVNAMNNAAGNGHLHVVKWLHEFRSEGCTIKAMNTAAANGHLETVKWLYEHRRAESCVTTAMVSAAADGELDALVWLYGNTTEGCTACVLDRVLREPALYAQAPKRRLFLHESQDVPVLNTLRWLRGHAQARVGCRGCCFERPGWGLDWRLSTLVACRGDLQLLAYLHEHFSDEFRRPMDHFAVSSALVSDVTMQSLGHLRAVQWVFTHYPKAFDWKAVRNAAKYEPIDDLDGWLSLSNEDDERSGSSNESSSEE